MPQLPSGRQVAVDPTPLGELLQGANSPFHAHHIMAIGQVDDLYRWLDILAVCAEGDLPSVLRVGARKVDDAPAVFVSTPIGRLAGWDALAGEWSEADREAFRAFIDERVRPAASDGMWRSVVECREKLVRTPSMAGALAVM